MYYRIGSTEYCYIPTLSDQKSVSSQIRTRDSGEEYKILRAKLIEPFFYPKGPSPYTITLSNLQHA
jgi:hypothetical protein